MKRLASLEASSPRPRSWDRAEMPALLRRVGRGSGARARAWACRSRSEHREKRRPARPARFFGRKFAESIEPHITVWLTTRKPGGYHPHDISVERGRLIPFIALTPRVE